MLIFLYLAIIPKVLIAVSSCLVPTSRLNACYFLGQTAARIAHFERSLQVHPSNGSVVLKNLARRIAVSAVIPRFSRTISLMRGAGTCSLLFNLLVVISVNFRLRRPRRAAPGRRFNTDSLMPMLCCPSGLPFRGIHIDIDACCVVLIFQVCFQVVLAESCNTAELSSIRSFRNAGCRRFAGGTSRFLPVLRNARVSALPKLRITVRWQRKALMTPSVQCERS